MSDSRGAAGGAMLSLIIWSCFTKSSARLSTAESTTGILVRDCIMLVVRVSLFEFSRILHVMRVLRAHRRVHHLKACAWPTSRR